MLRSLDCLKSKRTWVYLAIGLSIVYSALVALSMNDYVIPTVDMWVLKSIFATGPHIHIGLCKETDSPHDQVMNWAKALATAAFSHDHQVRFVHVEQNGAVSSFGTPEPEILICLGFFFHNGLQDPRRKYMSEKNAAAFEEKALWPEQHPKAIAPLIVDGKRRPFLVAHNNEANYDGPCHGFDVMLDCKKNYLHHGCPSIYVPYGLRMLYYRNDPQGDMQKLMRSNVSMDEVEDILAQKTSVMAMIVRYCDHDIYAIDASLRVAVFDLLVRQFGGPEKNGMLSLGACKSNAELPSSLSDHTLSFMDQVVRAFKPFKFALVFENNAEQGYLTEKILNAFLADAIPVYFGHPGIRNVFNPERFIFCEFPIESLRARNAEGERLNKDKAEWLKDVARNELESCVAHIKMVERDTDLFKYMLRQPIFRDGQLPDDFNITAIGQKFRLLYETASELREPV
jgi:hypothetical protein